MTFVGNPPRSIVGCASGDQHTTWTAYSMTSLWPSPWSFDWSNTALRLPFCGDQGVSFAGAYGGDHRLERFVLEPFSLSSPASIFRGITRACAMQRSQDFLPPVFDISLTTLTKLPRAVGIKMLR